MTRMSGWLKPATTVYAHCDVPCGIYDPHQAELAARTVARMVELIGQLPKENRTEADMAKFVRCITIKEQHRGDREARDPGHLERLLQARTRRALPGPPRSNLEDPQAGVQEQAEHRRAAAAELEVAVKEFADIFWSTKK